ncbi:MAG: XisH family protein [Anaerolineae bacterium]|nr:XisH family protein [Anaerolineae bacterium]
MPSKDQIHERVKIALIKEGWTITHDPFFIRLGEVRTYADLGAERPFAAQKGSQKIVVEVKSFTGRSPIYDLEQAIGQFGLYKALLAEIEPDRQVYMAVSTSVYASLFDTTAGKVIIRELNIALCIVDLETQEVKQWIN